MRALVVVASLLLLLPPPPSSAGAPLPQGCEEVEGYLRCEWRFETRTQPAATGFEFEVPTTDSTLATVIVAFDGADRGWRVAFRDEQGSLISQSYHIADDAARTSTREETTHLLLQEGKTRLTLGFSTSATLVAGSYVYGVGPASLGDFTIIYLAEALPAGEAPTRPAATREDPHLADLPLDAEDELDIRAAWFDDARIGDGILEAYLGLGNLSAWAPGASQQGRANGYTLAFTIGDHPYSLFVSLYPGQGGPELSCALQSGTPPRIIANPACAIDAPNATIVFRFPERALGPPPAGVAFEQMRAGSSRSLATGTADDAETMRYAFALGGPEVWSQLNPRLDPPVASAAWYRDPLASENIPNTLQVLGTMAAVVTTLVGIVVLLRNRRQTRELIARVDALVRQHEADTHGALRALGELELEFTRLYREGRINEAQYQIAAQRVVAAASRLSVRAQLGLDDGTPR